MVNVVKELVLAAEAGDVLGDPGEEPQTVTSESGYDLTLSDLDAALLHEDPLPVGRLGPRLWESANLARPMSYGIGR